MLWAVMLMMAIAFIPSVFIKRPPRPVPAAQVDSAPPAVAGTVPPGSAPVATPANPAQGGGVLVPVGALAPVVLGHDVEPVRPDGVEQQARRHPVTGGARPRLEPVPAGRVLPRQRLHHPGQFRL